VSNSDQIFSTAYLLEGAEEQLHSSRSIHSINPISRFPSVVGLTGTAARIENAPAPATKRNAMNSPTWVLPARTAPETRFSSAACEVFSYLELPRGFSRWLTTAIAHFLPHLSATVGRRSDPITPPVWKRPFIVEIRSVPLLLVARLKYSMNVGWPVDVSCCASNVEICREIQVRSYLKSCQ